VITETINTLFSVVNFLKYVVTVFITLTFHKDTLEVWLDLL